MPACDECNKGTSTSDLAVSLASRWSADMPSPQAQLDHARLAARIKKQAPEMVTEWTGSTPAQEAQARLHLIKHGVNVPVSAELATVGPLTIRQFNLFAHKAVLALYFEHLRRPLTDAGCFWATWRTKEDFAREGIPPIFFEMLPNYGTLVQGRWNEQKTFEYRHAVNLQERLFGCLARFRRGFYAFGFAAGDTTVLPPNDMDWVRPSELLSLVGSAHFSKRR
jgi:hypothetical protein